MNNNISQEISKKLLWAGITLIMVILLGTIGYSIIDQGEDTPLIDCLFMTVITISTIGYREVINLSGNSSGKIFTMFLAFSGIGILTYVFSTLAAFAVEGALKETFRRKRMEKRIKKLSNHFIICGINRVGLHIAKELSSTNRDFVVIEQDKSLIEDVINQYPDWLYIEGEGMDDNVLLRAGIERATGLFASMDDDHKNIVISLTSRQLNPELKIIAGNYDPLNRAKIIRAGANNVISPDFIGGLRMASEMIRPAAVSFLDIMLRDKDKNLRVEDFIISEKYFGKKILDLNIAKFSNSLLLAVRSESNWIYNPGETYIINENDILVMMTTPEEREKILKAVSEI
ncbi:MAG: potassium channel protein [Candidatus Cloacimonadota bacterium]|nr:potassium channel protein [Candidatus Cloacimonadota bacterium]